VRPPGDVRVAGLLDDPYGIGGVDQSGGLAGCRTAHLDASVTHQRDGMLA